MERLYIVGNLGNNISGSHFTNNVYEHPDELLLQGAQELGMSGGPAINGKGNK